MPRKKPIHSRPASQKPVKQPVTQTIKQATSGRKLIHLPFSERIDKFLDHNLKKIFWVSFGLTLLSGLLLFDIRISTSGDDSAYIIRAADFIHHFILPGFQGPLYPVILSPFVGLFGIRVVLLKFISLLFMLGFTVFTFKAFKGRIPALLLTSLLFLFSVNSYILYYASQTYSEACFMLLQALTILVFFRFFIDKEEEAHFAGRIKKHLILAVCVAGLALTRSIGLAAVLAIAVFFLFEGQWKNLVGFILSFSLVIFLFETFKFLIWRSNDLNFTIQLQNLMSKDYYNPSLGKESLLGFVHRFADNSNQYLSNNLYSIIGLRGSDDSLGVHPVLTVLTYLMLLSSLIIAFRKNKYLFFTGVYTLAFLVSTFFIVQTYWGQSRLIIPYIPLILLMILSLFYFVLQLKQLSSFHWIMPALVIVLFILAIKGTIPNVVDARKVTNRYNGLTPDWKNYCRISEWAGDHLPEDAIIACRKPSISFIYSHGKRFYGIMHIPSCPGDSILLNWKQKHLNYYLISASSIGNNPVSKELYNDFKRSIVGFGVENNGDTHMMKFYIMDFPDSIRTRTLDELYRSKIPVISDPGSLKLLLDQPGSGISIICPDSLIRMLLKAKVTHVLMAHLANYLTVERFMSYIEFRYPEIGTKIMQVGSNDEEAASIYKLNYEKYGLRLHH